MLYGSLFALMFMSMVLISTGEIQRAFDSVSADPTDGVYLAVIPLSFLRLKWYLMHHKHLVQCHHCFVRSRVRCEPGESDECRNSGYRDITTKSIHHHNFVLSVFEALQLQVTYLYDYSCVNNSLICELVLPRYMIGGCLLALGTAWEIRARFESPHLWMVNL